MAVAGRQIIEMVLDRPLDEEDVRDLEWQFRELLEDARSSNLSINFAAGGTRFLLGIRRQHETSHQVTIPSVGVMHQGSGRVTGFELTFGIARTAPAELRRRFQALGVPERGFVVPRPQIEVPVILHGEPGFAEHRPPSIHIAPGAGDIPAELTWSAGRALAGRAGPWLTRYRAGDCVAVWRELCALGHDVRRPDVLGDAVDVALETMQRVRIGVEQVHRRLVAQGYSFADPDAAVLPAVRDADQRIAQLERCVGPLPLSLCAFYTILGAVDFRGLHPGWASPGEAVLDPMVVSHADWVLDYDEENWRRHVYRLDFAPDRFHKEDISGGALYALRAPCALADDVVEDEPTRPTFVELLHRSLAFGGFPGWSQVDPDRRPARLLAELTAGLLAL